MADYVWAQTGRIFGGDRTAGLDADEIEVLPSRTIKRMLDRGWITLKQSAPEPVGGEILVNDGAPDAEVGEDGDVYIDRVAKTYYGPKTAGAWGAPSSMLGTVGVQGPPGLDAVGPYVTLEQYEADQVVTHKGGSWRAKQTTTQEPSSTATEWELLAAPGSRIFSGDGPPPAGAPSVRSSRASTVPPGNGSIAFAALSDVQVGDLLVMAVYNLFGWGTTPAGWTLQEYRQQGSVGYGEGYVRLFTKVAAEADIGATYSFATSGGGAYSVGVLMAIKDVDTATPVADTASNGTGGPGVVAIPNVVAARDLSRIIDIAFSYGNSGHAPPSITGATAIVTADQGDNAVTAAYRSANAGTVTGAVVSRAENHGGLVTLSLAINPAAVVSAARDDDFYLDTGEGDLYGPLTAGLWGDPTSLVGPAGTDATLATAAKGEWDAVTDYALGDVVSRRGLLFTASGEPAAGADPLSQNGALGAVVGSVSGGSSGNGTAQAAFKFRVLAPQRIKGIGGNWTGASSAGTLGLASAVSGGPVWLVDSTGVDAKKALTPAAGENTVTFDGYVDLVPGVDYYWVADGNGASLLRTNGAMTEVGVTRYATMYYGATFTSTTSYEGNWRLCGIVASPWKQLTNGDVAWRTPTLLNSWTPQNANPGEQPAYRKDASGVVHLRGIVQTGVQFQAILNLPPGYRPGGERRFAVPSDGAFGWVGVEADGDVVAQAGSVTWFDLSGITFLAEA